MSNCPTGSDVDYAPWNQTEKKGLDCPVCGSGNCFEATRPMIQINTFTRKATKINVTFGICRDCWHKSDIENF